jgi:drug/metabolite transporter (DMT)-like permease
VTTRSERPDAATLAAFFAVAVFGGINAIALKLSVRELEPFWAVGSRFAVAGLLLGAFVLATRRAFPRGRSLAGAALYGSIGLAGSFGLVAPALREVPAATAMVFIALVPLETFALAILHRQERFRLQGLVGALISLGGVLLVVYDQVGAAVPLHWMGVILIGTLFIAESSIVLKTIPRADPYATNCVAMLTGGAILVALSAVAGEGWTLPTQPATWISMAYLVLLGSIALFGLYLYALRRWTASAVSYTTLLMPLVTIPIGALLLAEPVSPVFLMGAGVAVAGIYVGAFLTLRPRRSTATALPECLPIEECQPGPARSGSPGLAR